MSKKELKPCPFCEISKRNSVVIFEDEGKYHGMCWDCLGRTKDYDSQEEAIKAWNTRPKPSVKWPSLKDEVANGDGKGKMDEWSIGWNEAVKVCQAAVEAAGLEYGLDAKFINHIKAHLKEGEKVICKICGMSADGIINTNALKLAERELITRKEK